MQLVATERCRWFRCAAGFIVLALLAPLTPSATAAQLIAVKTGPVADAGQFSFFPSLTSGMGGVSIAIADSAHDPFMNPATGARVRQSLFFSAPTVYSVSGDAGRGSTYPLGALARAGASFGAAAVAIQSITDGKSLSPFGELSGGGDSHSNRYGFLMLGRSFEASRLAIAASAFWSDLGTIDGTSLLYMGSRSVNQTGRASDVRLGMLKEWKGKESLEAIVFNHRIGMAHDVTYGDQYWDPVRRAPVIIDRVEHERDRSNAWGVHLEYARPLGDSGWRAGLILTANRIDNPSRPAYEIESVPGSRGRASAFNIGVGVARSLGATTVAADAIYEPIWSRIWSAESDDSVATPASTALSGANTIDNRLQFSNTILRSGVSHDLTIGQESRLQLQVGVQARSMFYSLDQRDLVTGAVREGNRNWMEWTRSWGASLRGTAVEFHYRGKTMSGAARPGVAGFNDGLLPATPPRTLDILPFPAPETATLRAVSVTTHQVSISLRIR